MIRLLVTALFVLAPAQDGTEQLVTDVLAADGPTRTKAYRVLMRKKPPDALKLLITGVHEATVISQELAMNLIQAYPREKSQNALRALLKSPSPFVAFAVSIRLFQLGDKGHAERIARAFTAGRSDPDVMVRMVSRSSNLSIPALHECFRSVIDPKLSLGTLDQVLFCLARHGYRAALADVERLLGDASLDVQRRSICAAFALALGGVEQEIHLIASLEGEEAIALPRLHKFLALAPELSDELLFVIGERLEHERNVNQIAALIRLLGQHGKPSAVRWIKTMVEHEDTVVAKAAVKALVDLNKIDATTLHRLLNGKRKDLVLIAADTLRRMDDPSGLPNVLEVAHSKHDKLETIRVLGGFRDKQVVPLLIDALQHPNQAVRNRASAGLSANLRALYPFRRLDLRTAGYKANGPAPQRRAAVAQIRAWWQANR